MIDSKMQVVIARIQKLMALAGNNPNENEALAAAEKAQAMLAEYNLEMADITKAGMAPMSNMTIDQSYETDNYAWRLGIGAAIGELYFCAYFFRKTGTYKFTHCFAGERHHTTIARMMFAYIVETVDRLAREGAKSVPDNERSPYRTTFRQQASARLQQRIRNRIRDAMAGDIESEKTTGTTLPALLSMYEQEKTKVDAYMKKEFPVMKTKKITLTNIHDKGATDGRAAADKIGLDPQLEKRAAQRKISNG